MPVGAYEVRHVCATCRYAAPTKSVNRRTTCRLRGGSVVTLQHCDQWEQRKVVPGDGNARDLFR